MKTIGEVRSPLEDLAQTVHRAIVDITSGGGDGTLCGPNVLADSTVTANEGPIPGTECLTYADDGSARCSYARNRRTTRVDGPKWGRGA